jgi:hypothetical protein
MDMILQALVTGATALATTAGTSAGRELYEQLKAAVFDRFGGDDDIRHELDKLEQKPDSEARKAVLAEMLDETDIGTDDAVLEMASRLLEHLQPGSSADVVEQTATGDNIIQTAGDHNTASINVQR